MEQAVSSILRRSGLPIRRLCGSSLIDRCERTSGHSQLAWLSTLSTSPPPLLCGPSAGPMYFWARAYRAILARKLAHCAVPRLSTTHDALVRHGPVAQQAFSCRAWHGSVPSRAEEAHCTSLPTTACAASTMAATVPTVTKSPPSLVPPAGPTPGGSLPLSSIDKTTAVRSVRLSVDILQVFPAPTSSPSSAIAAMREGFAKALVPYYPVAGRIAEPVPGEPEIECTGEGVWFVEAAANCSLEEARNLERPLCIPKEELLPRPPAGVHVEDTPLLAQVTKFTCGGFAVGICLSHLVFDAQGAAHFLQAVGEMARGLPEPSIKPIWARDAIPSPPKPPSGPPPSFSFTSFNFEKSIVDISLDSIKRVKDQVASETSQKCSTFDVVTAIIFKCRALAIDFAPDAEVRLRFAASTRHLLSNVLPSVQGYYGNTVYPGGLTKTSQEVKEASVVEIVTMIREAKEALSSRFLDWLSGGAKENHYKMSLDYGTLVVTDLSHVGFNEVDYGFGEPSYVFALNPDVNIVPFVVYLKPPKPKQGIRLVLHCVEGKHSSVFSEELQKYA